MAYKPVTQKLETGQCTFVYMSQEEAEEYSAVLLAYEKAKNSGVIEGHTALGLHQNSETKRWDMVTITYNPLTKDAKIDKIEEVATLKRYAVGKFRQKLEKLKLV